MCTWACITFAVADVLVAWMNRDAQDQSQSATLTTISCLMVLQAPIISNGYPTQRCYRHTMRE
jgi:hypothetical protein